MQPGLERPLRKLFAIYATDTVLHGPGRCTASPGILVTIVRSADAVVVVVTVWVVSDSAVVDASDLDEAAPLGVDPTAAIAASQSVRLCSG